jgi:hypothetical protein
MLTKAAMPLTIKAAMDERDRLLTTQLKNICRGC